MDITNRKNIDKALKKSETQYCMLIENSPIGIMSVDTSGKIIRVNPKALEIVGSPSLEATMKINMFEFKPLQDIGISDAIKSVIKSGKSIQNEVKYTSKWSKTSFIKYSISTFNDENAKILGVQIIIDDISKRKSTEQALQESEVKFRAIYENSKDAIGVSKNGIHITVNKEYLKLFGYDKLEEIFSTSILNLIAPDERPKVIENVKKRTAGNAPSNYLTKGLRKDNSEFDMDVSASSFMINKEQYTLVILRDVTEQNQAKVALQKSKEKYRMLISNQTDMIVKVDTEGSFLFVSPSYCKTFGKTEDELIGYTFMPLVHEDDRESTAKAMENLYHPPYNVYLEQPAMTKDRWKWLSWVDTTILDEK